VGASERWLVVLLRFGGVLLGTAVLAIFLPDAVMAAIHRRLGLGEYPGAPLTAYLTRSVAALYAFHGGLLLALSTDVRRFRPVLVFVAWATLAFGLALTGIDLHAGLPVWWTLLEGPWVLLVGVLLVVLTRRLPRGGAAGGVARARSGSGGGGW
jgi:hypothetical protein